MKKKILSFLMVLMLSSFLLNNYQVMAEDSNTSNATAIALADDLSINDIPQSYKSSIEWVWNNRMLKEGTPNYKNLIFDQIFAGKGTINYVVRWQSSKNVTLEQRKKIAAMLSRQINNWTECLVGYDGWPYAKIPVKVVGWACADPSQILNKQADEIVYTDYITDDLSASNPQIPAKLPIAPSELSRFDHYMNANYSYPGGLDKRFDMYLWATATWQGGSGGDWGQRMSDDYILNSLDINELTIMEHEIGHGFGFPDFYEEAGRPPGGFPTSTIMWAGNSQTITDWDKWLIRYTWSHLKDDTSRFHP